MSIDGFASETRTYLGVERTVFVRRADGPGIVLLHELPGITPELERLALILANDGYAVVMPSLSGVPGKPEDPLYTNTVLARLCISREFAVFASNASSPIVDWLRELCKAFHHETNSPLGIGVIGLCLTGNFALALAVGTDGAVQAPIMGEPSLPFPIPFVANAGAIHLSPDESAAIKQSDVPAIGLRFTNDYRCKAQRFQSYEALLSPARFEKIEIQSPDPTNGISADAHSVLTSELRRTPESHPTNQALLRVLVFLSARLRRRKGDTS